MNTPTHKNSIAPMKLLKGSVAFSSMLAKSPKTIIGMTNALVRTYCQNVPHDTLNSDQRLLLTPSSSPHMIAILAPGFQLDGTSLSGIKKFLNKRGIPALFPEGLPYGKEAVLFRDHPQSLVDEIVLYTRKMQEKYPTAHILVIGHSAGGAQALHAVDQLQKEQKNIPESPRIIPITIAGVLDTIGSSAEALHALYYRTPSRVFTGKDDDFIAQARHIQGAQKLGITFVDLADGFLPEHVQSGVRYNEIMQPKLLLSSKKSPGHYLQGCNPEYSQYVAHRVVEEVLKTPGISQP